jgi:hypothetical protein
MWRDRVNGVDVLLLTPSYGDLTMMFRLRIQSGGGVVGENEEHVTYQGVHFGSTEVSEMQPEGQMTRLKVMTLSLQEVMKYRLKSCRAVHRIQRTRSTILPIQNCGYTLCRYGVWVEEARGMRMTRETVRAILALHLVTMAY